MNWFLMASICLWVIGGLVALYQYRRCPESFDGEFFLEVFCSLGAIPVALGGLIWLFQHITILVNW
jgi:hypothetical protein